MIKVKNTKKYLIDEKFLAAFQEMFEEIETFLACFPHIREGLVLNGYIDHSSEVMIELEEFVISFNDIVKTIEGVAQKNVQDIALRSFRGKEGEA